jgi:hypothetical protein
MQIYENACNFAKINENQCNFPQVPARPMNCRQPKAQPFVQRRAQPWYIGRMACHVLLCLAVFGPTGQQEGFWLGR